MFHLLAKSLVGGSLESTLATFVGSQIKDLAFGPGDKTSSKKLPTKFSKGNVSRVIDPDQKGIRRVEASRASRPASTDPFGPNTSIERLIAKARAWEKMYIDASAGAVKTVATQRGISF
jgi:hypothetical protein